MIIQGFAAIIASFGFAVLFNIRGNKLIVASLIGGSGGIMYYVAQAIGWNQIISLFVASVLISVLSEVFARVLKTPVTTFLICALIPLVPGGGMYNTMLEVVRDNIDGAIALGVDTLIQAGSIVVACTLVSSATRMFYQIKVRRKMLKK